MVSTRSSSGAGPSERPTPPTTKPTRATKGSTVLVPVLEGQEWPTSADTRSVAPREASPPPTTHETRGHVSAAQLLERLDPATLAAVRALIDERVAEEIVSRRVASPSYGVGHSPIEQRAGKRHMDEDTAEQVDTSNSFLNESPRSRPLDRNNQRALTPARQVFPRREEAVHVVPPGVYLPTARVAPSYPHMPPEYAAPYPHVPPEYAVPTNHRIPAAHGAAQNSSFPPQAGTNYPPYVSQFIPRQPGTAHAAPPGQSLVMTPEAIKAMIAAQLAAINPPKDQDNFNGDECSTALSSEILNTIMPDWFHFPQITQYEGKSDPEDHITLHLTSLFGRNVTDRMKCLLFPGTLKGPASDWFRSLPAGSIQDFAQLARLFRLRFAGLTRSKKSAAHIFAMRQEEKQSVRSWYNSFMAATSEVGTMTFTETLTAFGLGTTNKRLLKSLTLDPPSDPSELRVRARKYMKLEETLDCRQIELIGSGNAKPVETKPPTRKNRAEGPKLAIPPRAAIDNQARNETPLNAPRALILHEIQRRGLAELPPPRESPLGNDLNAVCNYHRGNGHDTEDCRNLRALVERLIGLGELDSFVQGNKPRSVYDNRRRQAPPRRDNRYQGRDDRANNDRRVRPRSPRPQPRAREDEQRRDEPRRGRDDNRRGRDEPRQDERVRGRDDPPARVIHSIAGGPSAGGSTSRARRVYARQNLSVGRRPRESSECFSLSFTEKDAEHVRFPHDDALVVRARLGQAEVRRILVDTGSSADILFLRTFEEMGLSRKDLTQVNTPLVSFTGSIAEPLGTITIILVMGTYPRQAICSVTFLVVDLPSAYNAIMGRPILNPTKSIASTYHLKLKFPTADGIGEVRGDQKESRSCYFASLHKESARGQA